jgi:hypothetical protein
MKDIFKFTPFWVKFTPFHAEPIRAQLKNLPAEVIELIKEHTRKGCEFNQKRCELKKFPFFNICFYIFLKAHKSPSCISSLQCPPFLSGFFLFSQFCDVTKVTIIHKMI